MPSIELSPAETIISNTFQAHFTLRIFSRTDELSCLP